MRGLLIQYEKRVGQVIVTSSSARFISIFDIFMFYARVLDPLRVLNPFLVLVNITVQLTTSTLKLRKVYVLH